LSPETSVLTHPFRGARLGVIRFYVIPRGGLFCFQDPPDMTPSGREPARRRSTGRRVELPPGRLDGRPGLF
jgi:hypothetical protein